MDKDKEIAALRAQLAEKDGIIAQKNQDLIGMRKQYEGKFRSLSEMTEEEKAKLSDAELELKRQTEALQLQQEEMQREQAQFRQQQRESHVNEAIRRLVGNDEKAAEKIKFNLDRIKGADEAVTAEDVSKYVNDAFFLLGDERPDPVRAAANFGGGDAPGAGDTKGFAETPAGQELGNLLNLNQTEANPPAPAPAPAPSPDFANPLA